MSGRIRWTAIGVSLASVALVATTLAPLANAAPPWARGGSTAQAKFMIKQFSKVEGWGNALGKLESLVHHQQQQINTLQKTVATQETELTTVMADLGLSSGTGTGTGTSQGTTVSGTVTAYTAPANGATGSIQIQQADGSSVTYPVAPQATITGSSGSTVTVQVGDSVQVQIAAGVVTAITDSGAATSNSSTVQGTVMAFTAPSGTTPGTLILLASGATTATSYSIAPNTPVLSGTTASTFAAITMNTNVQLTLQNGTVTQVNILQ